MNGYIGGRDRVSYIYFLEGEFCYVERRRENRH